MKTITRDTCQICGVRSGSLVAVRDLPRLCERCADAAVTVRACDGCGLPVEHVEYHDGLLSPHPQYRCVTRHNAPCGARCVRGVGHERGHGSSAYACPICREMREISPIESPPGLRVATIDDPPGTRVVVMSHDPPRMYADVIAEHKAVPGLRGGPIDWVRLAEHGWWYVGVLRVLP